MQIGNDHFFKFITIEIEFADLNAKDNFKRLTNTDSVNNPVLDFELIFPLPPNVSHSARVAWRYEVWGSDGIDAEGETMKEDGTIITYQLTAKIGMPIEFIKNLYLHSGITRARIHCIDSCDVVYANPSRTAPCKRRECDHEWCEMVFQEWEVEYNWSKLPHPLLNVDQMLSWIKDNFIGADDIEVGLIYHQILSEVVKFRRLANCNLVNEVKIEFERQASQCGNAYVQTMVMLNDYERSPGYVFKNGQSLIYKDAIDFYLKKTQPVRKIPRFPRKQWKKK